MHLVAAASLTCGQPGEGGVNRLGKLLHYYFNYSNELKSFAYPYAAGKDLLTGSAIIHAQSITLKPWDVAIVEED